MFGNSGLAHLVLCHLDVFENARSAPIQAVTAVDAWRGRAVLTTVASVCAIIVSGSARLSALGAVSRRMPVIDAAAASWVGHSL